LGSGNPVPQRRDGADTTAGDADESEKRWWAADAGGAEPGCRGGGGTSAAAIAIRCDDPMPPSRPGRGPDPAPSALIPHASTTRTRNHAAHRFLASAS